MLAFYTYILVYNNWWATILTYTLVFFFVRQNYSVVRTVSIIHASHFIIILNNPKNLK